MKKIKFFFRKKRYNTNSIEEVFSSIVGHIKNSESIEVPYQGAKWKSICGNISFARKNRGDVNHITGDIHYLAFGLGRNTILTIHDVHSIIKGNLVKKFIIKIIWFWLPAIIVKKITVISEFTKKEVLAIIPFAEKKIQVIYNPVNPKIRYIEKKFDKLCPRILHIGTKVNKNIFRTIKALDGINCIFIIVGLLNEEQIECLKQNKIRYKNYYDLSFPEMISLYEECDIISFPSTYEGFGMPVIEGNAAGRPVLAGKIDALIEIAGKSACFVNPYSIDDIRNGFIKIINDYEYRSHLVNEGFKNIRRFNYLNITSQYKSLYQQII